MLRLVLWGTFYSSSRRNEMRWKLRLVRWQRSLGFARVGGCVATSAVWMVFFFPLTSDVFMECACFRLHLCQNGLVYIGFLQNCPMCHRTRDTATRAWPAFRPLFSFSVGLSQSIVFTNFYKSLTYCQLRTTKIKVPSNIDSIYIFITFWGGKFRICF